jgi:hypothetical protein
MSAAQLFQTLTAGGCHLLRDGEHLRIQDPRHVLTDDLRQAIRRHKAALLAMLSPPTPAPARPGPVPSTQTIPLIEERWDLPPCRQCGGRLHWLNANLVPTAPWFMHCAHCSPPPTAGGTPGEEDRIPRTRPLGEGHL